MTTVVGELMVKLGLDDSGFSSNMDKAQGRLDKLQGTMNSAGKKLTMGMTAPLLAAGALAVKVADNFDKAYAIIRAGTGATGKALEDMKDITNDLYSELPNTLEDVATAVADVNTLFGAQGDELQKMAEQYLNLSRITGTDISSVIKTSARLFGDWNIATKDQADTLDYLFRVTQSTGIGIDKLNSSMVQYGAPLRQMGFDFETAAAMMGKFEKEGVNTELVLGSLRIALGTMAKEGVTDASEALGILIEDIKNAGSASEANARAIEVFGSRAGPDMAAAIREGRFEIDGLLETLKKGTETINGAAGDTLTFSDSLSKLKHNAELALLPLGQLIIDTLLENEDDLQDVVGVFVKLANAFKDLPDPIKGATLKILAFMAALGPMLWIGSKLVGVYSSIAGAVTGFGVAAASAGGASALLSAKMASLAAAASAVAPVAVAAALLYAYADATRKGLDIDWSTVPEETQMYQMTGLETAGYGMPFASQFDEQVRKMEDAAERAKSAFDLSGFLDKTKQKMKDNLTLKLEATIEAAEGEKEKVRAELEGALENLNVTFAGKFSDQTLRYLERMQSSGEDYSARYDIGSTQGLGFAIDSLTSALDPERLKEMGYSDEQIAELEKSVQIAGEQLTTQNSISAMAEEAAASLGLSAEEQKIAKEYLEGILSSAEEYRTSSAQLLDDANATLSSIDANVATAQAGLDAINASTQSVGSVISSLATAISNTPAPVVNISLKSLLGKDFPFFAEGGYTGSYEGLAYLHPNEYVIPEHKINQSGQLQGDSMVHSLLGELIDTVKRNSQQGTTNVFGADLERMAWKLRQGG